MKLWEAAITDHYLQRKAERGTIKEIHVSVPQVYRGYDIEETNRKLIPVLQAELDKRFTALETRDFGKSSEYNLGVIFFMPVLIAGQARSQIKMTATNGDSGIFYLSIVMGNALVTTYPEIYHQTFDIEHSITTHLKKEKKENGKPPKAISLQNYLFEIDVEELYKGKKEKEIELSKPTTSEEALDYTVRTDYRVGATFDHKKFGPGKIVSAAGGGKAGTNGILDWIEVKYDKPFVKGGKLQDTRRFENILTKAYFGKTLKK